MTIRRMTITDYDKVYALWMHTPGMGLNDLDDSREGIERYLRRNPSTCFVAEENGHITGAILAGHDGRRGFLYHTAVLETRQGHGIGKMLAEKAMDALEKEGIHKTALVVFERNQGGNAFWEKLGFMPRTDLVYRDKCIHVLERIDT